MVINFVVSLFYFSLSDPCVVFHPPATWRIRRPIADSRSRLGELTGAKNSLVREVGRMFSPTA